MGLEEEVSGGIDNCLLHDPHSKGNLAAQTCAAHYARCMHACMLGSRVHYLEQCDNIRKSLCKQINSDIILFGCGLVRHFTSSKTEDERQQIFLISLM